jgi:hypothetical protein
LYELLDWLLSLNLHLLVLVVLLMLLMLSQVHLLLIHLLLGLRLRVLLSELDMYHRAGLVVEVTDSTERFRDHLVVLRSWGLVVLSALLVVQRLLVTLVVVLL